MAVVEQRVTVTHEKGLHARPASEFVQMASNFDAEIQVRTEDGREGDAKSSLSVMSLGVEGVDETLIRSDEPDCEMNCDNHQYQISSVQSSISSNILSASPSRTAVANASS